MKILAFLMLIIVLAIAVRYSRYFPDDKGGLEDKIQTLELTPMLWACDCTDWVTDEDYEKYYDDIDDTLLARNCVFVEPASPLLKLPDTLGHFKDRIKFTGQFYKEKGFPEGYSSVQDPEKARVFRYTTYEVIRSNYAQSTELLKNKAYSF